MPARIEKSLIPRSPDLSFESAFWSHQINHIAGIDEAGRGSWAGPVVAAAVILPQGELIKNPLSEVRDSKQLSPSKRSELALVIKSHALAWGIGFADNHEIDQLGILPATILAMMRAVDVMKLIPEHLFIDALFLPDLEIAQTSLIKGDQRSLSIASASILAKTARDSWMTLIHQDYPNYRFDLHKGYGTKLHQEKLIIHGKCELHRNSYKPIQRLGDQ